jgi:glycosyltransferase involved in cell wall biosynthesis
MNPTVSIIVANYNYGRYLAQALDSIRAQTLADWEAIIVDDGSVDESVSVAKSYLTDSRFQLIQQRHAGQPKTKNAGIRAARGEFIAFLDADDRWHPTKLSRQLAVFQQLPNVGVVHARRRFINPIGQVTSIDERVFPNGRVLDDLFRNNFVCFSSAMLRRTAIDRCGLFDERIPLAIDYDWWLRIARHFDFFGVDEPLVDYRTGHANLSRRVFERLEIALGIMQRFQAEIDRPPLLSRSAARVAFAETLCHLGLVARHQPGRGLRFLMKSLRYQPVRPATWKAVVAALCPEWMRRLSRRLRGQQRDWDAALATPAREAA